jgi:transglutaminase-like putative cysteine protease
VIFWVRHRSTYEYEALVTYARCVLRLTPPTTAEQQVLDHAIAITPEPSDSLRRTGPFAEAVLTVVIDKPHRELIIEANSWVDLHPKPVEDWAESPAWEAVRDASYQAASLGPDSPAAFLYPTPRTPVVALITDYARASFPPGRPLVDAAAELMSRIRADFAYDAKATTVATPAAEAFAARRGVCQDFAHVMIAAVRGLGLPAAYVSGYLRTIPPPGKPRLQGADATHAWVSLWCGEARGWIAFDPTNAIVGQADHITLAVGRDYADVSPIDGLTLGPGEQALKVEVDVIPADDPAAARRPAARPSLSLVAAAARPAGAWTR